MGNGASTGRLMRLFVMAILAFAGMAGFAGTASAADGQVLKTWFADSGLPNSWIKGIFRDGGLVLVTSGDDVRGGTSSFDPESGRFVPFAPGAGFAGRRVAGWAEFGGKSYAGTESALNVREKGKWSSLDRFQQVQHAEEALFADAAALYAVARVMYGGVLKFDGKAWSIVDRGPGTGIMNNATSLLTRGGEIYIGTTTNGLFRYDGKAWKVVGPSDGLPGVWVTSLAVTDEGVWVGCYNGLALFEGDKLRKFTVDDGLPSNRVSALKVVKGRLLVGTMDAGLSIRTRRGFQNVSAANGLSDPRITAIGEADEGAWVGTVNGLNLVEVRE